MKIQNYKQHNKDSYNEIAEEYFNNNLKKQPDYLAEMLGELPEGMKILDIGCGPGNLIPLLQGLKPKSITELDNSPQMLAIGKTHFGAPNISFVEADYDEFQSEEKFDFVIAHLSFVHLPPDKLLQMLEQVKSNLKKGSYFFANYFMREKNDFILVKIDFKPGREESRYFAVYEKEFINRCYKDAGLEIVKNSIYTGRHFNRYNVLARY